MEWFAQLLILSLLGVVIASVLEEGNAEICTVFLLALLLLCLRLLYVPADACVKMATTLLEGAELSLEDFYLLFKGTLIAVVVRITAAFCRDVSRSALAVLVEFGGVVCVFLLSVPLLERVVSLLEGWL